MDKKDNNSEFVPEYFIWTTMEEQKKTVEKLEKIAKKKENNKKAEENEINCKNINKKWQN